MLPPLQLALSFAGPVNVAMISGLPSSITSPQLHFDLVLPMGPPT